MIAEVEGEEDLFVISGKVTDQGLLDAFARHLGPDEQLGRIPRALLQERAVVD